MTELISLFFQHLGIQIETLEIQDSGESIDIYIKTPDSHILIGMHGKNLEAFSHIIGRMVEKKRGKFSRIHLEVNDYIKNKEDRLFELLDTKIQGILSSGERIRIPHLSSYERKKAHDYIAEKQIAGLTTQSEGEGTERTICLLFTGNIESKKLPPKTPKTAPIIEDGVGI